MAKRLVGAKGKGAAAPGAERIPPGSRLSARLPLRRGDRGDAVRDLQRRLTAAGFGPAGRAVGLLLRRHRAPGRARSSSDRGLQRTASATTPPGPRWSRPAGCSATGCCHLRRPNLRGDDVAELQRRLGRLGFDAGRVDGIFGPDTANALTEFQRNIGLTPDGICGPRRSTPSSACAAGGHRPGRGRRAGGRAAEPRPAHPRRAGGSSSASSAAWARCPGPSAGRCRPAAPACSTLDDPDGAAQAAAANRFGADVYLGLVTADRRQHRLLRHRRLRVASAAAAWPTCSTRSWRRSSPPRRPPAGMRLPVLRETTMPAVLVAAPAGPTRARPQPPSWPPASPVRWPAGWSLRSPCPVG